MYEKIPEMLQFWEFWEISAAILRILTDQSTHSVRFLKILGGTLQNPPRVLGQRRLVPCRIGRDQIMAISPTKNCTISVLKLATPSSSYPLVMTNIAIENGDL